MSPQESNSLVMKGIYTFTRNPMYLGFLLWLFSLGVLLRNPISLIAIVLFIIYMNIFQIIPEENILEEKFGKEYLKYKENVRRWL
jgi:protein-S-isoprenylcysteine O-methyltransferase Ste14